MKTIRLTMSQALVRVMMAQKTEIKGRIEPFFKGVWAIFGHGNVTGLGEALYEHRDYLPTLRAHNEQGMVHAATAFAKASRRQQAMVCTSSIGPGALNMVTGAAVAYVNRLPLLLLPGDVFASRIPDPVLQQIENFADGTSTANDAFRSVSRYFDRITRPEQLIPAFQQAMRVLTDPADCGPATLSLCQDTQSEAFDYPESFFAERVHRVRRLAPDVRELDEAIALIRQSRRPLVVAGGGTLYSGVEGDLVSFCARTGVPVSETQAGRSAIPTSFSLGMGGIGVSGTTAANAMAKETDLLIAVGTRLQDFTTGSWGLFQNPDLKILALNVQPFDAVKHASVPLIADAKISLAALSDALGDWAARSEWTGKAERERASWHEISARYQAPGTSGLPTDAQVIGAVQAVAEPTDTVVCAAGGLPAELQKHWRVEQPGGYHMEYGFSCMGYELAGGMGVKLAHPEREVIVMLGDGSYLMLNSEIAASISLGLRMTVVLLDNHGYGCINRLQNYTGSASFNNLWKDCYQVESPEIDFVQLARGLGARAKKVASLAELSAAVTEARSADRTTVIVIDTDPMLATKEGSAWWDVAVPEVSSREQVNAARAAYEKARLVQRLAN
nr:3D-(3,5/4)-trihydroxycyclohexane-1,2-dione acylhydrolase (decyclizing) [Gluconacetobacter tumulicola]